MAQEIPDAERKMWEFVSSQGTAEAIETFIYAFPDSRLLPLAVQELQLVKEQSVAPGVEEAIFALTGPVSFNEPLVFGSDALIGKTIPEILKSSPTYPPVEGLPASYWENEDCSNCHQWTREAICAQAQNYIGMEPGHYQQKLHPFGGGFKINLRNWAQNDCN